MSARGKAFMYDKKIQLHKWNFTWTFKHFFMWIKIPFFSPVEILCVWFLFFRESENMTLLISLELCMRWEKSEYGWSRPNSNTSVYISVYCLCWRVRNMMRDLVWSYIIMKHLRMMKELLSRECSNWNVILSSFYKQFYTLHTFILSYFLCIFCMLSTIFLQCIVMLQ